MVPVQNPELDHKIMRAHGRGDTFVLAGLYQQAAQIKRDAGDREASGFLLTQAYVYALDSGHPDAALLCKMLTAEGRESDG